MTNVEQMLMHLQSVLAVLGKPGATVNVDRLDLTIVDPEQSLSRTRRKTISTPSQANPSAEDDDEYEGTEDVELGGIEAKLIIKLVCRHGRSYSPS